MVASAMRRWSINSSEMKYFIELSLHDYNEQRTSAAVGYIRFKVHQEMLWAVDLSKYDY